MALGALTKRSLRSFRNLRRIAREQSAFKIFVILIAAIVLLGGLGVIFYDGFRFLHAFGGVGLMIIHRLFALFFFGLAMMLVFSSLVTAYSTIFRSDEVPSLMVRPVPLGQLVVYKYLETVLLSSWAFFFMIVPFVTAYAMHEDLSPLFSVWTLLFSMPFVMICSAVGVIICMVLVRIMPTGRSLALIIGGLVLVSLALLARMVFAETPETKDDASLILARLIPGLRLSSQPLWPSWWVAEGIMAMGRGAYVRGLSLLGLLVVNVLFLGVVIEQLGQRIFYAGWIKTAVSGTRQWRGPWVLELVRKMIRFLARPRAALVLKDMLVFLRDPVQWTQVLVFFGLLAIYFLNLRNMHYHTLMPAWKNLIVFLNIFSVSAVMCSLASRFVYPQMSLEGHSFWLIGMSPLGMRKALWTKFWVACLMMVLISTSLTLLSTHMLRVGFMLQLMATVLATAICIAVTGLSMGLGAIYMDLRQRNPAAIVSGFGGTLNLVLSMSFTFLVMIPFATFFHLHTLNRIPADRFNLAVAVGVVLLVLGTAVCCLTPMILGQRSLAKRDY